jgi:malonyl-CoA/methylmalonyl-CoA synthetase
MRATLQRCRPSSLLSAIASHPRSSPALTSRGQVVSYGELARSVQRLVCKFQQGAPSRRQRKLQSEQPPRRVAFLTPPTSAFVSTLLASWAAGCIAVPLSPLHPSQALASVIVDSTPSILVTAPPHDEGDVRGAASRHAEHHRFLHVRVPADEHGHGHNVAGAMEAQEQLGCLAAGVRGSGPAMLLYTSGTTGAPKGVVWTHAMLDYQVSTLSTQWRWSRHDRILNVLPPHHVHGVVNVLLTALYSGAHCLMMERFSADAVWAAFMAPAPQAPTVFMAVPTVYQRLIRWHDDASEADQAAMRRAAASLRLFVCGSAALSPSSLDAWHRISGHHILERYGMTEAGMVLSNPYDARVRSSLGVPLPGVQVRVVADEGDGAEEGGGTVVGELRVRGPGVFSRYWNREQETADAFDGDRWFRTGDIVRMQTESGRCEMVGRASTDIIKTGGYKVSALEIENVLAECPLVGASAVVGVDDDDLGQRLVCVVVPRETDQCASAGGDVDAVSSWLRGRLPRYKVPRDIRIVKDGDLPRNVLGKVQKQALKRACEREQSV